MCRLKYTLFCIDEAFLYTNLQPIFQDFMRMLASKKIRHGKVPPSYQKDLKKYCDDLNEGIGFSKPQVVLTPDILEENAYKCTFVKSIMNIAVGKMAQSQVRNQVEFTDSEERLTQLFNDNSLEVTSCFPLDEKTMQISYKKKDVNIKPNQKSQCVVNSAVTALSRIHLDQSLRTLLADGATLIYSDTDSTVFTVKRGAPVGLSFHPTQFGSFSSEVSEDEEISLFVCIGAKNYSYEVRNMATKEVVRRITKIRGLTLSGRVASTMDTNRMLQFVQMLQQHEQVQQAIPQMRIIIDKETKRLSAREIQSMYSNYSNQKRYYNSEAHPTKLWAYGTTSYG